MQWIDRLIVPLLSALGAAAMMAIGFSFRIGRLLQRIEGVSVDNGKDHVTLSGKIADVDRAAKRAHEKLDLHAIEIGMLKRDGANIVSRVDGGFGEVNAGLRELRDLVNKLLLRG